MGMVMGRDWEVEKRKRPYSCKEGDEHANRSKGKNSKLILLEGPIQRVGWTECLRMHSTGNDGVKC